MPDLHNMATFLPFLPSSLEVKVLGSEWDFCGSERGIMGWDGMGLGGCTGSIPVHYMVPSLASFVRCEHYSSTGRVGG